MDKIKHILFRSWFTLETLEERIYHIILDVAVFISVISVVVGLILGLPSSTVWSALFILLFLIVVQYITMRYPKYSNGCRIALTVGLNFVFLPLALYASGGIYCGIILFYLCSLFFCAVLLPGRLGGAIFLASVCFMELSLTLSTRIPYVQDVTEAQHLRHMKVCLLLAGVAIYSVAMLILRTYYQERSQNQELMKQLRILSTVDSLCGLYNRRVLFRRLETVYGVGEGDAPALSGRYIAMFDVDDFKKINDTYGHSFGDDVLVSIADCFKSLTDESAGELSSRYGGEEFVCLLRADGMAAAFDRLEETRKQIAGLRWEEQPGVSVSISGGLIACEEHPDLTQAMHDVDELLYKAKAAGKNRICTE